ncbi:MFS general substrate transporter [Artomyces pyxidatus]|uniref:MFS general substrate transporter n=1 Tax=Artomyces pyxidatus TaxID=48021 RepID=A0ACB8SX66_9AGAM|nr:MFS general substrate transporter [Artomyces pyxidatus]
MTGFAALPLADEAGPDPAAQWSGVAKILGPPWARLPTLTIGLVGVQVLWSVEMSYALPYLQSLGLSKSFMSIVLLAGPFSGLVVQPLIGVLADNSKSRFGRRRPYILSGVALCSCAILLLGFTRQFASIITTWGSSANDILTIWLAILSIFCIDFGINAVQAVDRALLVDTLPPTEQATGNAWAAVMLGIGSVAGFFFGGIDMPNLLPFFGKTELQILSVVSSILLIGTHLTMASLVKERILLASGQPQKSFRQEVLDLWVNARSLPYVIRQICIVQFFAWLAWFPILFYTTLYVGDLYRRSLPPSSATQTDAEIDAEATRLGARAQLYSSVLALITNFLAPFVIQLPKSSNHKLNRGAASEAVGDDPMILGGAKRWWEKKMHLATLWAVSHLLFAACMFGTFFTDSVAGATVLMTITGLPWAITQWAPFSLLAEAILTTPTLSGDGDLDDAQSILLADARTHLQTPRAAEAIFDVGDEDDHPGVDGAPRESDNSDDPVVDRNTEQEWDSGDDEEDETEDDRGSRRALMGNVDARRSWVDVADLADVDEGNVVGGGGDSRSGLSAKAGIILGIHNIFIVVPQFLVTALSSIIFAILEPDKSVLHQRLGMKPSPNGTVSDLASAIGNVTRAVLRQEGEQVPTPSGPNSVAIIFRLGGISSVVAFVICWRLAGDLRRRY